MYSRKVFNFDNYLVDFQRVAKLETYAFTSPNLIPDKTHFARNFIVMVVKVTCYAVDGTTDY